MHRTPHSSNSVDITNEIKQNIVTNLKKLYEDIADDDGTFNCVTESRECPGGRGKLDPDHYEYLGNEISVHDCHCNYRRVKRDYSVPLQTLDGQEAFPYGVSTVYPLGRKIDNAVGKQQQVIKFKCRCGAIVMRENSLCTRCTESNGIIEWNGQGQCMCQNNREIHERLETSDEKISCIEINSTLISNMNKIQERINATNTNLGCITEAISTVSAVINQFSETLNSFKIDHVNLIKSNSEMKVKVLRLEEVLTSTIEKQSILSVELTKLNKYLKQEFSLERKPQSTVSSNETSNLEVTSKPISELSEFPVDKSNGEISRKENLLPSTMTPRIQYIPEKKRHNSDPLPPKITPSKINQKKRRNTFPQTKLSTTNITKINGNDDSSAKHVVNDKKKQPNKYSPKYLKTGVTGTKHKKQPSNKSTPKTDLNEQTEPSEYKYDVHSSEYSNQLNESENLRFNDKSNVSIEQPLDNTSFMEKNIIQSDIADSFKNISSENGKFQMEESKANPTTEKILQENSNEKFMLEIEATKSILPTDANEEVVKESSSSNSTTQIDQTEKSRLETNIPVSVLSSNWIENISSKEKLPSLKTEFLAENTSQNDIKEKNNLELSSLANKVPPTDISMSEQKVDSTVQNNINKKTNLNKNSNNVSHINKFENRGTKTKAMVDYGHQNYKNKNTNLKTNPASHSSLPINKYENHTFKKEPVEHTTSPSDKNEKSNLMTNLSAKDITQIGKSNKSKTKSVEGRSLTKDKDKKTTFYRNLSTRTLENNYHQNDRQNNSNLQTNLTVKNVSPLYKSRNLKEKSKQLEENATLNSKNSEINQNKKLSTEDDLPYDKCRNCHCRKQQSSTAETDKTTKSSFSAELSALTEDSTSEEDDGKTNLNKKFSQKDVVSIDELENCNINTETLAVSTSQIDKNKEESLKIQDDFTETNVLPVDTTADNDLNKIPSAHTNSSNIIEANNNEIISTENDIGDKGTQTNEDKENRIEILSDDYRIKKPKVVRARNSVDSEGCVNIKIIPIESNNNECDHNSIRINHKSQIVSIENIAPLAVRLKNTVDKHNQKKSVLSKKPKTKPKSALNTHVIRHNLHFVTKINQHSGGKFKMNMCNTCIPSESSNQEQEATTYNLTPFAKQFWKQVKITAGIPVDNDDNSLMSTDSTCSDVSVSNIKNDRNEKTFNIR